VPKFVIEREVPGAGDLTRDELKEISQISCRVLSKLGSEIQWIESYVTGDKIYCIYRATNADLIREHAVLGGFPANRVSAIANVIDPSTAET
jgi:Nickel responsive protein SCO4226-like